MLSAIKLESGIDRATEKRILAACASVAVMGAIVWLATRGVHYVGSQEVWMFVGTHYSQIYFAAQAVTAVACFIYGFVLLLLRSSAASAEQWAKYLGWAFIVLWAQYCVLFSLDSFGRGSPRIMSEVVGVTFSVINNVLFVAAGLVLLDRKPFPKWNLMTQFSFGLLGIILSLLGFSFARFPDAIASAFCFFWIGYSLNRNIRSTTSSIPGWVRKIAGSIVVAAMVSYAAVGVVYASVPFLVRLEWNAKPIAVVEQAALTEATKHEKETILRSEQRNRGSSVQTVATDTIAIKRMLLDSALITMGFVLKFVIFNAGFFLLVWAIIFLSSPHASKIFEGMVERSDEFLVNSGITKYIVEELKAESVELFVKIPGSARSLFAKFAWTAADRSEQRGDEPTSIEESEVEDLSLCAIRTGEERRSVKPNSERLWLSHLTQLFPMSYERRLPSRVVIPMKFHGAVIGCMSVSRGFGDNFSPKEVQYIRDLSKLSILSVQSFREKSAFDQLSTRFSRLLTLTPVEDFRNAVDGITKILHDLLTPLATGIWLDVGLQQADSLEGEQRYKDRLRAWAEGIGGEATSALLEGGDPLETVERDLVVKPSGERHGETYTIGRFVLLVPAGKDPAHRPILGRSPSYFRAITARTTSGLLGVVMEYLNSVMRNLGIKIDTEQTMNVEDWFGEVQIAAAKAGLLWIVAEIPGEGRLLGEPAPIAALRQLQEQSSSLDEQGNHCYLKGADLPHSGIKLWFATRGSRYHDGEDVCPLWKPPLQKLGEMVDSSLYRITQQQERAALLANEAAQSYDLATIAVTTTEIIHQIVNNTWDIALPLQVIADSLEAGRLVCKSERVADLIKSGPEAASMLLTLAADFKRLSDPRDNQDCNLRQAALQAERLLALPLKDRRIVLETNIAESLTIGVPPHVAVMAIANLLSNSKDELPGGGHIAMSAWEEGEMIRCDVTDDGPGVSLEVIDRLFRERNVTTKLNGQGWGLYLVSRSLSDRHGSIELSDPGPDGTTFTIRFPRHTNGQVANLIVD